MSRRGASNGRASSTDSLRGSVARSGRWRSTARPGAGPGALLRSVGAEAATLVGQSMGGWTVLGCAAHHPERVARLVLTGTLAGLTDDAMTALLLDAIEQSAQGPFDAHAALATDFPSRD